MTKYERAVQTADKRTRVLHCGGAYSCVYIQGSRKAIYSKDMLSSEAHAIDDNIRAALIADMCRVAGIKPPKARKR